MPSGQGYHILSLHYRLCSAYFPSFDIQGFRVYIFINTFIEIFNYSSAVLVLKARRGNAVYGNAVKYYIVLTGRPGLLHY